MLLDRLVGACAFISRFVKLTFGIGSFGGYLVHELTRILVGDIEGAHADIILGIIDL